MGLLIKIINSSRNSPRRVTDLRRLITYLFTPQLSDDPLGNRLLGPAELDHLVTHHTTCNDELSVMVDDLAMQFDWYTREAGICQRNCSRPTECRGLKHCLGNVRPASWYAHLIFAFSPTSTDHLRSPPDQHRTPPRSASKSANAIRIARDALDLLGWSGTQPALFVVHGDKRHIHVHAVVATTVFDGGTWDAFRFSRRQLFEIAAICAETFQLSSGGDLIDNAPEDSPTPADSE